MTTATTSPKTPARLPTWRELIEEEEKLRELLRVKCVAASASARPHSEMKSESFKVRDTAHIDGGAYRWLELPDGSWRVEEWRGGKWLPGGANIEEFFDNPPVGPAFAARLGIPLSDLKSST
jgi:hypothetical protein